MTEVQRRRHSTADDQTKPAMNSNDRALTRGGYRSKMQLHGHDELLRESPPDEVPEVTELGERWMEHANP